VLDILGELPFALLYDGETIWSANSAHGTVTRKNLEGKTIAIYPVGSSPASIAFDGNSLWITNTSDDTVSKLTLP
jgi:DNA-binding beta-propeller fold protein YncE